MIQILIVEDDYDGRMLVAKSLMLKGHAVHYAEAVPEALTALEHPIDLIILDIHLPGLSGLDLLAIMQEQAHLRDIPVLVLTAHDRYQLSSSLDPFTNVKGVYVKPLGIRELHQDIDNFFNLEAE